MGGPLGDILDLYCLSWCPGVRGLRSLAKSKHSSRFLFWSKISQFCLWLYTTSKIIDNLSSFCHREWLLPLLQSGLPSNRTSDSAPLPLKSGIYHRDFQIDEEAQCCRHSLMLCRILHSYEFLCPRFVSRMSDSPSPLLSRLWLTKIALLIS